MGNCMGTSAAAPSIDGVAQRVRVIPLKPGTTAETLIDIAENGDIKAAIAALSGLISATTMLFVDDEGGLNMLTHAVYESQEDAEANAEKVKGIFGALKEHFAGAPTLYSGSKSMDIPTSARGVAKFTRFIVVPLKPDSEDKINEAMQEAGMWAALKGIEGLVSCRALFTDDTKLVVVARYSSLAALDAATEIVQNSFMKTMKPYFAGPPERKSVARIAWSFVKAAKSGGSGAIPHATPGALQPGCATLRIVPLKPDTEAEHLTAVLTQPKTSELIGGVEGLVGVTLTMATDEESGEKKILSMAEYGTKEQEAAAAPVVKEVLGALKEYLAGPPQPHASQDGVLPIACDATGTPTFARVSMFPHKPPIDNMVTVMSASGSFDRIQGADGLVKVKTFSTGDTLITMALYETKEQLVADTELIKDYMKAAMPYMAGPPKMRVVSKIIYTHDGKKGVCL